MKPQAGLFLLLVISSAFAFPARDPDDDAELVPVSRRQQTSRHDDDTDSEPDFKDFKGVVDTGSGYPFFSVRPYSPFGTGFFDNFDETFRRLRESLLNRWWSTIPQDSDFDPSEGNTTSVVKVIDGQRVEINDTVYTKTVDSGIGNSIFKVRVVNIRPLDSSEEATTSGPGEDKEIEDDKGSPEVIERGSQDNEILGNIDSTESTKFHTTSMHSSMEAEIVSTMQQSIQSSKLQIEDVDQSAQEAITSEVTNNTENSKEDNELSTHTNAISHNNFEKESEHVKLTTTEKEIEKDMDKSTEAALEWNSSSDGRVLQTNKHREPITGEFSDEYDDSWEGHNIEWDSISNDNDRNNNIDVYESIPVDLSNDIAVNEMLADQGAPFDPDAEVFSVDEFIPEFSKNKFHYHPIKSEPIRTSINFAPIKK